MFSHNRKGCRKYVLPMERTWWPGDHWPKEETVFSRILFLAGIGAKYGKTAAQVALHYLIQSGIIVIPKSVKIERMKENLNILDFTLSNEEIEEISKLDTGHGIAADFMNKEQLLNLYHILKTLKVWILVSGGPHLKKIKNRYRWHEDLPFVTFYFWALKQHDFEP